MATDQTFSLLGLTAAQVASTADLERNPRSSYYNVNKGLSRMDRGKLRIKKALKAALKPIKMLMNRTKTDRISKSDISGPSSFVNPASFVMLTGERPPTGSTAVNSTRTTPAQDSGQPNHNRESTYTLHAGRPGPSPFEEPVAQALGGRKVLIGHPTASAIIPPRTPATASTVSTSGSYLQPHVDRLRHDSTSTGILTPLQSNIARTAYNNSQRTKPDETPEDFAKRLAGEQKPDKPWNGARPVSAFVLDSRSTTSSNTLTVPGAGRVKSLPPTIPPPSPFNPHISGFDDPRATYVPGKYIQASSGLREVANTSDDDVQQNRDAAFDALEEGPAEIADNADVAAPPPRPEEKPQVKGENPAYRGSYCPDAPGPQIYFPVGSGLDRAFTIYDGTPYASSGALVTDRTSKSTFITTPSTAPSTPALPFTPGIRHSQFYKQMESGGTFSPVPHIRPAKPSPPATPDTASFLETVYKSPPTPPPQEQNSSGSVPLRKPVPEPDTKPAPDVNKSLPPSPALNPPRRYTGRFPPRVDSLANPVADAMYLHPNAKPASTSTTSASRGPFNDSGYPVLDALASRGYSQAPAYVKRGPMNEIEQEWREKKVKRQASGKLARERAEAKANKKRERQLRKEEEG